MLHAIRILDTPHPTALDQNENQDPYKRPPMTCKQLTPYVVGGALLTGFYVVVVILFHKYA